MRRASSIFASTMRAAAIAALSAALVAAPAKALAVRLSPTVPRAGVSVRVLTASPAASPSTVVDALEKSGYRVHVVLLPSTYYVTGPDGSRGLPASVRALDPGEVTFDPAPIVSTTLTDADPFGGRADAIVPPEAEPAPYARAPIAPLGAELPEGLPYGARWQDTSELMIGRVAVPILFPESDGTIDANHFSWTPSLRDSVVHAAVRGFMKWSLFAATRNLPLTFFIEPHAALATRYEPIDRPIGQETLWIEDVLEPLVGYRSDAIAMAFDYANAARARLSAQWSTLAFAVQNDTSATGTFPDGYIAHARLGGPYFVIPVNNLNTQSATLDFYFEHEVTHQFWALDEFPALNAWWACTLNTGYFNRPNWNSSIPTDVYCTGVPTVHCVMKGNYPDDYCKYTLEQVGWTDLDQTGIIDLFETRPVVRPDSTQYRTSAGLSITLRGEAADAALPNRNPFPLATGDSISIATIDSVQYRLDGGAWITIPCADGRCDFGAERYAVILPPPSPGTHSVNWRAWNSSGRTALTPSSTSITVSGATGGFGGPGSGAAPEAPRVTISPVPARGSAQVSLRALAGSRGTAILYDLAGRAVRHWPVSVPAEGRLDWKWDARGDGGGPAAAGLYFLIVRLGPNQISQRVILLR